MPFTTETLALKAALDETTDDIRWIVEVSPPDSDQFRFLLFTEAYRRAIGIGHEEMAGRSPFECMPISDAVTVTQHYAACVRARHKIQYSENLLIAGQWRWWQTTLTPKFDEDSRVYRLIGVSRLVEPIEAQLRSALRDDLLTVHYQPIARICPELFACLDENNRYGCLIGSEIVEGYEALIRWPNSQYSPEQFLPVAKSAGLMEHITRLVLFHAAKTLAKIQPHQWISVNVSNCDFEQDLTRAIELYEVPRKRLSFEVTEDCRLDPITIARFEHVRIMGHPVKIDDYGTNNANLSWLQILKADGLKLDKRFSQGVAGDANKQAICRNAIQTAREYDPPLEVVVEGIENIDDLRWFAAHGADAVQGYLVAKPRAI